MTMKQGVYIFVLGVVIHIPSAGATTLETVWLKDTTANFLRNKRTLSNIDFPNELRFHLTRRSETLYLNLRRNHDINPNPDFYFARKLQNGQLVLLKSRGTEKEDVAYYQDIKNGAFVTVRCVKRLNEQCDRIINGNVRIGHSDYVLQPAERDASSINLLKDQFILGRQYVLQDQTHTRRQYSIEKKEAAPENEKNIEQKRMALLRRFQEQQKQKHISPSVTALSSRNVSTLHNREGKDKSRNLPEIYYIKVAVLIDSGSWDFYSSTVHSNLLTKIKNAKRKIQQLYSHIMNGVNMLYEGIKDPGIRINVILSEFIIFTRKSEFQHEESEVVRYNGIYHIEAEAYLSDVKSWDEKTNVERNKTFSHGMLFTRYQLDDKDPSETSCTRGLTYTGEVCNVGTRMSIIEIRGYVGMVHTAAHELGHSLGASHDGEGTAIACKANDSFIMSSETERDFPGRPYSKNRWLFSKCSVNSFKDTLKNKTCVRNHGLYYDYEKYRNHVKNEPGEVFTVDEQCELIVGRGSVLCETDPEDICLTMRCTDPKLGICIMEYHGAARGTECGRNKWCIDGLCVPKRKT